MNKGWINELHECDNHSHNKWYEFRKGLETMRTSKRASINYLRVYPFFHFITEHQREACSRGNLHNHLPKKDWFVFKMARPNLPMILDFNTRFHLNNLYPLQGILKIDRNYTWDCLNLRNSTFFHPSSAFHAYLGLDSKILTVF